MVFIYGGAWYVGTSDMYPGENLALNGDVVVVSFNYRLNVSSKLPIIPIDISCSMFWEERRIGEENDLIFDMVYVKIKNDRYLPQYQKRCLIESNMHRILCLESMNWTMP